MRITKELLPVPGIHHVLDQIKALLCCFQWALRKGDLNLGLIKALHYFEGNVFSAYDINKWKPDPSLFLYAAKKMGFEPSQCCVVEDSMSGVKAAIAGGFDVFAYTTQDLAPSFKEMGAFVLHDMKELLHHI